MINRVGKSAFCLGLFVFWLPGHVLFAQQSSTVLGSNPSLVDGAMALQMRNYETGLRLTQDGLKSAASNRDRTSAYSNLCAAHVGLQNYSAAIEACDKALELNDRNWRIYNNRALALLGAGQVAAAREAMEKGLALNPDSVTLQKVADLIEAREGRQIVSQNDTADTQNPQPVVITDCDPAC